MNIGKLKVGQLRKELEARGLDTSGTRPALMKRLREALDRQEEKQAQQDNGSAELATRYSEKHHQEAQAHEKPDVQNDPVREAREQNQHRDSEQADESGPSEQKGRESFADEQVTQTTEETGMEPSTGVDVGNGQQDGESGEQRRVSASGSLAVASETSMDERMKKRRERFGAVEKSSSSVGNKRKSKGDSEESRKFEEAKARRAAKFGPISGMDPSVSTEERERRLKRQRRFQSVGKATDATVV